MFLKTDPIIVTLAGISIFFSCSQQQNPGAEIKGRSAGAQIFYANCVVCHGPDGKRQYEGAKDLSISTLSMEKRIEVISSAQIIGNILHKPRWEKILSENEIKEVAQFLDSLKK